VRDTTLAIIPAYNEGKNIADVVRNTLDQGLEVLVIDDCSQDNTAQKAREAGAKVISLPLNLGYAAALQTGYFYARDKGYQYIVQLDGDGQHDPAYCKVLLDSLRTNKVHVVMGSRFLNGESYKVPVARRLGQKLFATMAGAWLNTKITDPTTGFQALTADVVSVYCTNIFPEDYPDADLRILLDRMGFQVIEVPVKMNPSQSGSMHRGVLRPLYYCIKMSLALFLAPIRKLPNKTRK